MAVYQAKHRTVEAFTMEDGRVIIVDTPPRIVSAEEFAEAFEPAPERRRNAGRVKAERRRPRIVKPRTNGKAAEKAETNGAAEVDPKARALALKKEGLSVTAIAEKIGRPYGTVYAWLRNGKTATTPRAPKERKAEPAHAGDAGWME